MNKSRLRRFFVTFSSAGAKRDKEPSPVTAGNLMAKIIRPGEKILVGCGRPGYFADQARADGFVYELKRHGFMEDQWTIYHTGRAYEEAYRQLEEIFSYESDYHGLYVSIEPNSAAGQFLADNHLQDSVKVICHDLSPSTKIYLEKGVFDFVIGQDIYNQGYKALLTLCDMVRFGKKDMPEYRNDLIIYDSTILETLSAEES